MHSASSPGFPAEGFQRASSVRPPLQGGCTLTTAVGSSNTMQLTAMHGYLKSVRSRAEPPTAWARRRFFPPPSVARWRRGHGAGYHGGLMIWRQVDWQWLAGELWDLGVFGEVCLPRDNVSQSGAVREATTRSSLGGQYRRPAQGCRSGTCKRGEIRFEFTLRDGTPSDRMLFDRSGQPVVTVEAECFSTNPMP